MTSSYRPDFQSPRFRAALLGALVTVLVLCVASLILLFTTTSSGSPPERVVDVFTGSNEVQAEREDAMSQARQLVLRVGTYGPEMLEGNQMPDYRASVTEVMTSKLAADFEKNGAPLAEQTVAQTDITRTAEVFSTGVSVIDEDSATVLVAGVFQSALPQQGQQQATQPEPAPFRYIMELDKVDGEWLVDKYEPATKAVQ